MGCRCARDAAASLRGLLSTSGVACRPRSLTARGRRAAHTATHVASADTAHIAVVGGGLTGLTTAYYLAKKLPQTARITVYEATGRLGGWVQTERLEVDVAGVQGKVSFERGPRTMTSLASSTWRYDDLVLWDLALDLGLPIHQPIDKPRFLYYPDHLVGLPPHAPLLSLLQEPLLWNLLPAGLGYLWREWGRRSAQPLGEDDMSISQWLQEMCGSPVLGDTAASALIHGSYGGDIYKLSARCVFDELFYKHRLQPALKRLPANVFLCTPQERAFLDEMRRDSKLCQLASSPKGSILTFGPHGMETLPRALENALESQANVEVKKGTAVRSIAYEPNRGKVEVQTSGQKDIAEYDKVIYTLPSKDLARMTGDRVPSLTQTHCVSIMRVHLWYPQTRLNPPGLGYLIPRSVPHEQNPERALGVFFDSDLDAPSAGDLDGTKLFVLMGGHHYDPEKATPPPSEDEAVEQAKALVSRHLGIPADTPCFATARLAKDCIPQHYVGHDARMRDADRQLKAAFDGRLAAAGGSYTRIGVMGALRAGYDAASRTAGAGFLETGLDRPLTYEEADLVQADLQRHPVRSPFPRVIVRRREG